MVDMLMFMGEATITGAEVTGMITAVMEGTAMITEATVDMGMTTREDW